MVFKLWVLLLWSKFWKWKIGRLCWGGLGRWILNLRVLFFLSFFFWVCMLWRCVRMWFFGWMLLGVVRFLRLRGRRIRLGWCCLFWGSWGLRLGRSLSLWWGCMGCLRLRWGWGVWWGIGCMWRLLFIWWFWMGFFEGFWG